MGVAAASGGEGEAAAGEERGVCDVKNELSSDGDGVGGEGDGVSRVEGAEGVDCGAVSLSDNRDGVSSAGLGGGTGGRGEEGICFRVRGDSGRGDRFACRAGVSDVTGGIDESPDDVEDKEGEGEGEEEEDGEEDGSDGVSEGFGCSGDGEGLRAGGEGETDRSGLDGRKGEEEGAGEEADNDEEGES